MSTGLCKYTERELQVTADHLIIAMWMCLEEDEYIAVHYLCYELHQPSSKLFSAFKRNN